ncbi:MAG: HAMP domain-containing protein, partial [Sinobacteraceae bacterium]|nr:HAMP domain-containing protein [Nevskiaceae bacterium]
MRVGSVLLDSLAHLRLWQKLALLFAAMSIPALLLATFLALRIGAAIHQARNELEGARYLQALGGVAAEMVTHRGRAYAYLSGDRARRTDVGVQAAEVDRQIVLMDGVVHSLAAADAVAPEWQQIKSQWDRLKTQTEQQTAAENDVAHAALAAQIGRLAASVGIHSGMTFDPQAQTGILVHIASDIAPKLRLAASEMRRYAVHAAAQGNLAADDRMAISILRARQVALLTDMQNALAETSAASRALLQPAIDAATSAANDFYSVVNIKLLLAPAVSVAPGAIYDAGVPANRALRKVSLSCYEALASAIAARLAALTHERMLGATLLLSLLGLAVLLVWMINRSMARPLRHAVSVFGHIAGGKYDSLIRLQGRDEATQVLRALHRMQGHLQAQIGAARNAAAENARIREALDRATVGVLLADRQLRITYLNDSMSKLFVQHQEQIRKVLTGFDSRQLLGRELPSMFADATRARAQLESLQAVSSEDLCFGKLVVRTVTSPVLASDGTRLGTVMEWSERSEETRIENEMHDMLAAVIEGDLSRRLEVQGRAGLSAMLGSGVNQLAEVLAQLVGQAQASADEIHRAAREIASGNANLQQRTQQQSASLEQTASSMEEMTSTVRQNADNAAQANQLARTARNQAEEGGAVVGRAVQ